MTVVRGECLAHAFVTKHPLIADRVRVFLGSLPRRAIRSPPLWVSLALLVPATWIDQLVGGCGSEPYVYSLCPDLAVAAVDSEPGELLRALEEADIPNLPEAASEITKLIKSVAANSLELEVQTRRSKQKRLIELKLNKELPASQDHSDPEEVISLEKPVSPVTLSPGKQDVAPKPDKTATSSEAGDHTTEKVP